MRNLILGALASVALVGGSFAAGLAVSGASAAPAASHVRSCASVRTWVGNATGTHSDVICGGLVRDAGSVHWLCKITRGTPGKTFARESCKGWTDGTQPVP